MKKISDVTCVAIFAAINGDYHGREDDGFVSCTVNAVTDAKNDRAAALLLKSQGWDESALCAKAIRGIAALLLEKTPSGDLMRMILKLNRV